MQTKFKRHQKVRILTDPDPEYVEYHNPDDESELKKIPIKKGMFGRVNLILPNGQYHVQIEKEDKIIAYCAVSEDHLEAI